MKHMMETEKIDNQIHFLGKLYSLNIQSADKNSLEVKETEIQLRVNSSSVIEKLIQKLYRNTLRKVVEENAKYIISLFDMPKNVEFTFKNAKGYYGECFPTKKRIILSTKLAKYDMKYILSVLYHECAHFKYQNHQKEFYLYLEERYPNYRQVQRELRKIKYNDKY